MSNKFLNKAIESGAAVKRTVASSGTWLKGAVNDMSPGQKLGFGLGITGLTASNINNIAKAQSTAKAESERLKIEEKNLKALQSIHKALTTSV